MNQLKNSVQLIGHAGITPEIKETTNGTKVARFSIATSETFKNKDGEKVTDTQWHNLVLWGKNAIIAEKFIQKGSKIAVKGKISNRSYTNREGKKKFLSQIIVSNVLLMGSAA